MSLATQRLSNKPKTSDLVLERGQHVRLPFGLDEEVAADVAQQQGQGTNDLAARRWPLAATRHLLKSLPHRPMVSRSAVLVTIGIALFAVFAAYAQAKVKDPRNCTFKGTPGAPIYCASRAAEAAVKAQMIRRTHNPRWNLTVICNAEIVSQPLHQKCGWHSDRRRMSWGATVVFAQTARGWIVRLTIRGPVPGI